MAITVEFRNFANTQIISTLPDGSPILQTTKILELSSEGNFYDPYATDSWQGYTKLDKNNGQVCAGLFDENARYVSESTPISELNPTETDPERYILESYYDVPIRIREVCIGQPYIYMDRLDNNWITSYMPTSILQTALGTLPTYNEDLIFSTWGVSPNTSINSIDSIDTVQDLINSGLLINGVISVYAIFSELINQIAITFDYAGGTLNSSPNLTLPVDVGSQLWSISSFDAGFPTRSGYYFNGWAVSGTSINTDYSFVAPVTVTALWGTGTAPNVTLTTSAGTYTEPAWTYLKDFNATWTQPDFDLLDDESISFRQDAYYGTYVCHIVAPTTNTVDYNWSNMESLNYHWNDVSSKVWNDFLNILPFDIGRSWGFTNANGIVFELHGTDQYHGIENIELYVKTPDGTEYSLWNATNGYQASISDTFITWDLPTLTFTIGAPSGLDQEWLPQNRESFLSVFDIYAVAVNMGLPEAPRYMVGSSQTLNPNVTDKEDYITLNIANFGSLKWFIAGSTLATVLSEYGYQPPVGYIVSQWTSSLTGNILYPEITLYEDGTLIPTLIPYSPQNSIVYMPIHGNYGMFNFGIYSEETITIPVAIGDPVKPYLSGLSGVLNSEYTFSYWSVNNTTYEPIYKNFVSATTQVYGVYNRQDQFAYPRKFYLIPEDSIFRPNDFNSLDLNDLNSINLINPKGLGSSYEYTDRANGQFRSRNWISEEKSRSELGTITFDAIIKDYDGFTTIGDWASRFDNLLLMEYSNNVQPRYWRVVISEMTRSEIAFSMSNHFVETITFQKLSPAFEIEYIKDYNESHTVNYETNTIKSYVFLNTASFAQAAAVTSVTISATNKTTGKVINDQLNTNLSIPGVNYIRYSTIPYKDSITTSATYNDPNGTNLYGNLDIINSQPLILDNIGNWELAITNNVGGIVWNTITSQTYNDIDTNVWYSFGNKQRFVGLIIREKEI